MGPKLPRQVWMESGHCSRYHLPMRGYRTDDTPTWDVPLYRTAWWKTDRGQGLLILVVSLAMCFVINQFTTAMKAVEITGALGLFYVLISTLWLYHREAWFWATISIFAVFHAVAIVFVSVQLPTGPAFPQFLPVMMGDAFVMFMVLKLLASKLSSKEPSD
jgi:hypothetical protein